jgi:hypothetical protein
MPGSRPIRPERETAEVADMIHRVARSLARRAEGGDIDALEELVKLQHDLDGYIDRAARGLHAEPGRYSWGEIGRWLGITRQAARQRFGQ